MSRHKFNRDDALAVALARGESITDAARQAGLSPRTAHRRLADPQFSDQVRRLRNELVDRVCGRLVDSGDQAAQTLRRLLDATSEAVQLSASKAILESVVRFQNDTQVERRIAELERQIDDLLEARHAAAG